MYEIQLLTVLILSILKGRTQENSWISDGRSFCLNSINFERPHSRAVRDGGILLIEVLILSILKGRTQDLLSWRLYYGWKVLILSILKGRTQESIKTANEELEKCLNSINFERPHSRPLWGVSYNEEICLNSINFERPHSRIYGWYSNTSQKQS